MNISVCSPRSLSIEPRGVRQADRNKFRKESKYKEKIKIWPPHEYAKFILDNNSSYSFYLSADIYIC